MQWVDSKALVMVVLLGSAQVLGVNESTVIRVLLQADCDLAA